MKTIVTLAILWLALAAAGNAQSITVSSPSPASSWCQGRTLTINWDKIGDWSHLDMMAGTKYVTIVLHPSASPSPLLTISAGALNKGVFSWVIPTTVPTDSYRVRVQTIDRQAAGESGIFSIAACSMPVKAPLNQHVIDVKPKLNFPLGRIEGRVSGWWHSDFIHGHKVRVILKKEGVLVMANVYTLDDQGSRNYRFLGLAPGTYEITVEKVATPILPPGVGNLCFTDTTPAVRSVAINDSTSSGNDFLINYTLLFGSARPSCW